MYGHDLGESKKFKIILSLKLILSLLVYHVTIK
nr:MAG TPA: hypothetical protein [Caudoviricetes sp.]